MSSVNALVPSAVKTWTMYTAPSVPTSRTLVLLGEAPGADEEKAGIPFVGSSGAELNRMMGDAGLDRQEWHILNVFCQRPPNNDLTPWTGNKSDFKTIGHVPHGPPLNVKGKKRWVLPEHQWQLEELDKRLRELQPDLILALGATALWAISGESSISAFRGNFFKSRFGCSAIATFHPAAVLYQYSNRPLCWADLVKTRLWLAGELPAPLKRRLWVNPNFGEIAVVYSLFARNPSWLLGTDIETCPSIGQITTVSFSTPHEGICIPFWDRHAAPGKENYWPTVADEVRAWKWVDRFNRLPNPKVMQNGLYDMQYELDAPIQLRVLHAKDDTAILQHSLQPELPKALGTLSSLYLNEPSWKQMRTSIKDMNKADE